MVHRVECAPEGGQVARLELTGNAGLSAGIPHMEPSQPVECGSKPLDVQFAFE